MKRIENSKTPKNNKKSESTFYSRNQYIKELVKRLAQGKCQLCCEPAPFTDKFGEPYQEEHHVVRLADDGQDVLKNVTALCPNCHRKMHILNDKLDQIVLEGIAQTMIKKLPYYKKLNN